MEKEKAKKGGFVGRTNVCSYAMVPERLLKDPEIGLGPKVLFGLIHCHCFGDKYNPEVVFSQQELAGELGVSRIAINRWLRVLKSRGYAAVKRQGVNCPGLIELNLSRKR